MKKITFWGVLLAFLFAYNILQVNAQCTQQVTHLSGSQQVGCTQVTVTSDGSVSSFTECPVNPKQPYWAGPLFPMPYRWCGGPCRALFFLWPTRMSARAAAPP
jgi:hypothetical protein